MIQSFLDHFSATFWASDLSFVVGLSVRLADEVKTVSYQQDYGFYRGEWFNFAFGDPDSFFRVGARPLSEGYSCRLELHGSYLACLSYDEQLAQLERLYLLPSFNPTRVDLALDDYDRRVSFAEVHQVGLDGRFKPFQTYKFISSKEISQDISGDTCQFGSGARVLRFYNAELLHDISADRWEYQLRDAPARTALNLLFSRDFIPASLILGSVMFFQDLDKQYLIDWWQSLISDVNVVAPVRVSIRSPYFFERLEWLRDQVAPTLALAYHGLGESYSDFHKNLIDDGTSRFKRSHRAALERFELSGGVSSINFEGFFDV